MALRCLVPPPAAADDVLKPLHAGHRHRNIVTRCMVVGEDAALAEHLV